MSRPLRINYPDAIYRVMNRGTARSYGVVGWACNGIRKKIESNRAFKIKVASIYQQRI